MQNYRPSAVPGWPRAAERVTSGDVASTSSSEADFYVLAKAIEERLDQGEIVEALSWREVGREDDLLQVGLAQGIEIELPRQHPCQRVAMPGKPLI